MTSLMDILPLRGRQTEPVQRLIDHLFDAFYGNKGDRAKLQPVFTEAHLGERDMDRALQVGFDKMREAFGVAAEGNQNDPSRHSHAAAEGVFAVARIFDWR